MSKLGLEIFEILNLNLRSTNQKSKRLCRLGRTKTKLMLNSTQVEVEVGVELGNTYYYTPLCFFTRWRCERKCEFPKKEVHFQSYTSLAVPGALTYHLQRCNASKIKNDRQAGAKLALNNNFCKINFLIQAFLLWEIWTTEEKKIRDVLQEREGETF